MFEAQLIFPLNGWHNHAPSLVECPNGDLLACWFSGSGERTADDVRWRISRPILGAGAVQPSLLRRRDGTLVAYMRDNGPPPNRVFVAYSRDDGETWTEAEKTSLPNPGSSVAALLCAQASGCSSATTPSRDATSSPSGSRTTRGALGDLPATWNAMNPNTDATPTRAQFRHATGRFM